MRASLVIETTPFMDLTYNEQEDILSALKCLRPFICESTALFGMNLMFPSAINSKNPKIGLPLLLPGSVMTRASLFQNRLYLDNLSTLRKMLRAMLMFIVIRGLPLGYFPNLFSIHSRPYLMITIQTTP